MTGRFSRSAVLSELYSRIDTIITHEKFDTGRGPAQIDGVESVPALLRAIAYGRMQALQQLAADIEHGRVKEKP